MAERVVGTGSFGIVFQVKINEVINFKVISRFMMSLMSSISYFFTPPGCVSIFLIWNTGKVLGDWWGGGYKEGFARQAVQKSWTAVNARDGSPKCNFLEALFFLYNKQRRTFSELGHGVCPWDDVPSSKTLQ